jgi:Mg-chelatase subunit ChlD
MWGAISDAQVSMDDLMLFAGDVVKSLRVGLVAYRDRRDEFEAKYWDFTTSIPEARERLWGLTADGGADYRESVNKGLLAAYTQLSWDPANSRVLVLIGDAPPHVGVGGHCVSYATRAHANGVITHAIQADDKPVKFFDEIASAGGGQAVMLEEGASLVAEITGLSLGDKFEAEIREFFLIYLELCR